MTPLYWLGTAALVLTILLASLTTVATANQWSKRRRQLASIGLIASSATLIIVAVWSILQIFSS